MPRSTWNLVTRHFLNLLLLVEVLLLIGGSLLINREVQQFALVTLAVTIAFRLAIVLLGEYMLGHIRPRGLVKYLGVPAVAFLAALGIFQGFEIAGTLSTDLQASVQRLSAGSRKDRRGRFRRSLRPIPDRERGASWLGKIPTPLTVCSHDAYGADHPRPGAIGGCAWYGASTPPVNRYIRGDDPNSLSDTFRYIGRPAAYWYARRVGATSDPWFPQRIESRSPFHEHISPKTGGPALSLFDA